MASKSEFSMGLCHPLKSGSGIFQKYSIQKIPRNIGQDLILERQSPWNMPFQSLFVAKPNLFCCKKSHLNKLDSLSCLCLSFIPSNSILWKFSPSLGHWVVSVSECLCLTTHETLVEHHSISRYRSMGTGACLHRCLTLNFIIFGGPRNDDDERKVRPLSPGPPHIFIRDKNPLNRPN